MRLFEAIVDANHRAVAGDVNAGLHPADFESELPVIALTCVDPRLNALFPNVLGLPGEEFIWLRNAGNIITGPMSSTMRSLALACAVKGGKEIAIIGHTDCQVCQTNALQLFEKLKALGVERNRLPDNINDYFGLFASERQNVIKACDIVRRSPLIGPKIPVHGLMADLETGRLEWVVNGYDTLQLVPGPTEFMKPAGQTMDAFNLSGGFNMGEMKFPEAKIGETVIHTQDFLSQQIGKMEMKPMEAPPVSGTVQPVTEAPKQVARVCREALAAAKDGRQKTAVPPKIPIPPPIRPRVTLPARKPG